MTLASSIVAAEAGYGCAFVTGIDWNEMTDPETGLSEGQLVALGQIAYWSGQAEAGLSFVVSTLIGGHGADTVVLGKSFSELADLCLRLIATRPDLAKMRADVELDVKKLTKTMETRNVMLHGFWDSAEIPRGAPVTVSIQRRRGVRSLENQTEERMRETAQALADSTLGVFFSLISIQDIEAGRVPQERYRPLAGR